MLCCIVLISTTSPGILGTTLTKATTINASHKINHKKELTFLSIIIERLTKVNETKDHRQDQNSLLSWIQRPKNTISNYSLSRLAELIRISLFVLLSNIFWKCSDISRYWFKIKPLHSWSDSVSQIQNNTPFSSVIVKKSKRYALYYFRIFVLLGLFMLFQSWLDSLCCMSARYRMEVDKQRLW